jgi:hypothetical protein
LITVAIERGGFMLRVHFFDNAVANPEDTMHTSMIATADHATILVPFHHAARPHSPGPQEPSARRRHAGHLGEVNTASFD